MKAKNDEKGKMKSRSVNRLVLLLIFMMMIFIMILVPGIYAVQAQPEKVITVIGPSPKHIDIKYLDKLPPISSEERLRREKNLENTYKSSKRKIVISNISNINNSDAITNIPNGKFAVGLQNPINFDNSIFTFQNTPVPISSYWKSSTGEPSLGAFNDQNIFYTGNWYAAVSSDGGNTFNYIDPFSDMFDFCCDQDVLYDYVRNIFLWYRQGVPDSSGNNRFRLGVSTDNLKTWYFYDFQAKDINQNWNGWEWDYPQMALGDNYLYITTNMYRGVSDSKSVILRMPLDSLKAQTTFNIDYYYDDYPIFDYTPVQGSRNIIYWGTFNNWENPQFLRIYIWPENGQVTFVDRAFLHTWPATYNGDSYCPGPDNLNWCGFTDQRISSGWKLDGYIGFFWDVKNNPSLGYKNPYIEVAMFDTKNNFNNIGMPSIYNNSYAMQYGFGSTDTKGNLGFAGFFGGGNYYPSLFVGVMDTVNLYQQEIKPIEYGNNGPPSNRWGDFIRVRPLGNDIWYATGYTLQGGSTGANSDPRYIVFGRDINNINVFVRGTDNALWYRSWDGNSWSNWNSLGGIITSDPSSVSMSNFTGKIVVLARGNDKALWYRHYSCISIGTCVWSDWVSLGGILTSGPSAVSQNPSSLDVFVRGTDNALWHRKISDGNWESLGGMLTSDPKAFSVGNYIIVLVRGTDNALWYRSWDGYSWSDWKSLNGILNQGPSGTGSYLSKLNIYAVGNDYNLWEKIFDGISWQNWNNLGGILTSDPDAVSLGTNNIVVFGRGTDNALWYRYWNGNSWDNWKSLGGILASGPGASSY